MTKRGKLVCVELPFSGVAIFLYVLTVIINCAFIPIKAENLALNFLSYKKTHWVFI